MNEGVEVGFLSPEATRDRAKSLATAYNLLWVVANDAQKATILPYKQAWESYFRRIHDSWMTALLETNEIDAHEAKFERLRKQIEDQGADVHQVPAISPPRSALEPMVQASANMGRVITLATTAAGLLATYLVFRNMFERKRP